MNFIYNFLKQKRGFTIPELLIVMSVFGILITFITINLLGLQRKTSLNAVVTTLITDMKHQQVKAMSGDTEGRSSSDNYGIYFESDRYTLFHGNYYVLSDTSNFVVNLSEDLEFSSILFPSSTMLFANGSGEIVDFNPGLNTIVLRNKGTGEKKTIEINKHGVITGVN